MKFVSNSNSGCANSMSKKPSFGKYLSIPLKNRLQFPEIFQSPEKSHNHEVATQSNNSIQKAVSITSFMNTEIDPVPVKKKTQSS